VSEIIRVADIDWDRIIFSCKNTGEPKETKNKVVQNKILQQSDGTISLKVDKADCYQDMVNPSSNTAEWNVVGF